MISFANVEEGQLVLRQNDIREEHQQSTAWNLGTILAYCN